LSLSRRAGSAGTMHSVKLVELTARLHPSRQLRHGHSEADRVRWY
jgi:hypothetical protein